MANNSKTDSNRLDEQSDGKSSLPEKTKKSQLGSTNYEDTNGNNSETDPFESIGGTLNDGIKSMKMFPILNSYQEIDSNNRSYLWKLYLEGLGGKYVIIDKLDHDHDSQNDLSENTYNEQDKVIRKIEISTLINSDSELYETQLDLENQAIISLDIDRTRNSIKHAKIKAEKMLTLFWKLHNIKYKQGMNEIVSLFLL
jgi:hypothetical protein